MGICDFSEELNDSTAGLTSTGYHSFTGNTLYITNGATEISGNILSKAVDKYNSSFWKEDIKDKLLEEKKNNPKLEEDIKMMYGMDLDTFAATLGDEEAFKEQFLLPHYKPNIVLKELDSLISDIKELKDQGDSITENQLRNCLERINERKNTLSQSKLELILTECIASKVNNFLFRTIVNNVYDFGVLHSALSLDGTIIEWGRGPCGKNLICPTLDIKEFLFAFEIKAKEDEGFFKLIWKIIKAAGTFILNLFFGGSFGRWAIGNTNSDKVNKIAKICVQYNRYKYYNAASNNCQHFVKTILQEIGSDFRFDGEFGRIIRQLENDGKIDFIFQGKTFNTRKELDNFVKSISFENLSVNDKKLLICYKNTFDIYLRNDPNNEKYQSTKEDDIFWRDLITKEKENMVG